MAENGPFLARQQATEPVTPDEYKVGAPTACYFYSTLPLQLCYKKR
jgi:hypothetical protein